MTYEIFKNSNVICSKEVLLVATSSANGKRLNYDKAEYIM